ncbi:hypothetical protein OG21DRAFT_1173521 [Imleria badia]|nr:hypothetical protein OG21DRAFT_1173521 [Imleria badia]
MAGILFHVAFTRSTPHIAAKSDRVCTSLMHTQTATVIANCHLHDITFGNTFLALAQVAMTRVLYRRYLRGKIEEEECAYRKRQPCISEGPISLCPYLDKVWFQRGDGGETMMSIDSFHSQLPFMTLGEMTEQHQRGLSDVIPYFIEIGHAADLAETKQTGFDTLQWIKCIETANGHGKLDHDVLAVSDIPLVWAFEGSSADNMDLMTPTEYALPPTHPLSSYSSAPHPFKSGYATSTRGNRL